MLIPRGASDAWEAGHVFAHILNSRAALDVVTDAESPWHCHCPGGALPLRRGRHCDCINKTSKRAPPGLQHDVVTDAESPRHCTCPGPKVPVRYGDGHCACVEPHSKRQNDRISISSGGLLEAAVTASKSIITAPKLSVTSPSTFVTNTKSSTTQHNNSESTAQVTVAVKANLPLARPSSITAVIQAPQTTDEDGSESDESNTIDVSATLPILHRPVLVCLFGACFASSELSSITGSLAKRVEYRHLGGLPQLKGSCDENNISICLQDHRTCFCHIPKRQLGAAAAAASLIQQCPDKNVLVCGAEASSCHCTEIPSGALTPVPQSCDAGALVCFEGLCYCPLVTGRENNKPKPTENVLLAGLGPFA